MLQYTIRFSHSIIYNDKYFGFSFLRHGRFYAKQIDDLYQFYNVYLSNIYFKELNWRNYDRI